ncbi:MAG: YIP1 family protein [Dehalococcoidia bacterium]|nr:YIP1 family protein [Dehalococcoidia bacterium]
MSAKTRQDTIWRKMIRAAKLDVDLYEEVEADSRATGQAFLVVIIVSIAAGIGTGLGGIIEGGGLQFLWGLLVGLFTSIAGWLIWALITYVVGTTIFKGPETKATYGELLRTLGFAQSPGVFRILAFIPFIGWLILLVTWVWSLVAGVIAVRQALDFSTGRAIATVVVGWIVAVVIVFVVTALVVGAGAIF